MLPIKSESLHSGFLARVLNSLAVVAAMHFPKSFIFTNVVSSGDFPLYFINRKNIIPHITPVTFS